MQNNILVSVVVPVYNVEKYLSRCVDSILRQTYNNLQIILVDDGSNDKSAVICNEYAKKDTRILVIHKNNGGLSDARNVGIDNAKGDYICFIDSDDFVRETYVEDLLNAILKYEADIAMCLFEKGTDYYFKHDFENFLPMEIELTNLVALDKLYDKKLGINMVIACNKIYNIRLFDNIRFPFGKIHEDEFTIPKLLYKSKKIIIISKYNYYYYQSLNSITRSSFNFNKLDAIEAFIERANFFYLIKEYELYKKTIKSLIILLFDYFDNINNQDYNKFIYYKIKRFKLKNKLIKVVLKGRIGLKEKIYFFLLILVPFKAKKIINLVKKICK